MSDAALWTDLASEEGLAVWVWSVGLFAQKASVVDNCVSRVAWGAGTIAPVEGEAAGVDYDAGMVWIEYGAFWAFDACASVEGFAILVDENGRTFHAVLIYQIVTRVALCA